MLEELVLACTKAKAETMGESHSWRAIKVQFDKDLPTIRPADGLTGDMGIAKAALDMARVKSVSKEAVLPWGRPPKHWQLESITIDAHQPDLVEKLDIACSLARRAARHQCLREQASNQVESVKSLLADPCLKMSTTYVEVGLVAALTAKRQHSLVCRLERELLKHYKLSENTRGARFDRHDTLVDPIVDSLTTECIKGLEAALADPPSSLQQLSKEDVHVFCGELKTSLAIEVERLRLSWGPHRRKLIETVQKIQIAHESVFQPECKGR